MGRRGRRIHKKRNLPQSNGELHAAEFPVALGKVSPRQWRMMEADLLSHSKLPYEVCLRTTLFGCKQNAAALKSSNCQRCMRYLQARYPRLLAWAVLDLFWESEFPPDLVAPVELHPRPSSPTPSPEPAPREEPQFGPRRNPVLEQRLAKDMMTLSSPEEWSPGAGLALPQSRPLAKRTKPTNTSEPASRYLLQRGEMRTASLSSHAAPDVPPLNRGGDYPPAQRATSTPSWKDRPPPRPQRAEDLQAAETRRKAMAQKLMQAEWDAIYGLEIVFRSMNHHHTGARAGIHYN